MWWCSKQVCLPTELSLVVGGTYGTGASPAHGQCEMEARACAAAKDFSKLFATIALAVKAVMEVKTAAVGHVHNDAFMNPLHKLAAIFDRVEAALLGLTKIFSESADAMKELGNPPTRSTVNLRHFAICATVTPHPPSCWTGCAMLPLRARHPPLSTLFRQIYLSIYIRGSHLCCALHVQDAAALATDLYASLTRPTGLPLLFCGTPRVTPEEAGRQLEADTLRVKMYFSALLIEQGLPVTAWGPGG